MTIGTLKWLRRSVCRPLNIAAATFAMSVTAGLGIAPANADTCPCFNAADVVAYCETRKSGREYYYYPEIPAAGETFVKCGERTPGNIGRQFGFVTSYTANSDHPYCVTPTKKTIMEGSYEATRPAAVACANALYDAAKQLGLAN